MTLPSYAMNRANFPEMYERMLVEPLFRPWAKVLLQRVDLSAGDRVLDIACGTGIVARLAMERLGAGGRVVGVDLSPPMLAVARGIAPAIEWREGNACALPLGAGEVFDAVLCHQGLQFFPDKSSAVREMKRALAPGGRLALATWRPVEEIPLVQALHVVAERHVGAVQDHRHSFGEAAPIEALLVGAGFHQVKIETMSRVVRFADPAVFLRMNATALVGMSAAASSMDDAGRAEAASRIAQECSEDLPRFSDGDGFAFEISTNVATARA